MLSNPNNLDLSNLPGEMIKYFNENDVEVQKIEDDGCVCCANFKWFINRELENEMAEKFSTNPYLNGDPLVAEIVDRLDDPEVAEAAKERAYLLKRGLGGGETYTSAEIGEGVIEYVPSGMITGF